MKNIYEKYKHILPFALYFFVYMTWFSWLEQRHIWKYQVIHMAVDNYIPFNEVFIIPYFLWFVYVPAGTWLCTIRMTTTEQPSFSAPE